MSLELLLKHRETWTAKELLRTIYKEWYREITKLLGEGTTMELCGGTGNLKEFAPAIFSTDVQYVPWMDAVVNAEQLPFKPCSLSNLVLIDGLHHIANVCLFFEEACRALRKNGRIIFLEPYISFLSWPFYHFIHEEPVDFSRHPLDTASAKKGTRPFDANQAVATILFEKDYSRFEQRFPALRKIIHRYETSFAYTLSGGFGHPQLVPANMAKTLASLEKKIPFPGRFTAFRILVVLEKQ